MAKQVKEEKRPTTSRKEVKKTEVKARIYSVNGYCDIIGAQKGIRYVANLKFKDGTKKPAKEWKESFEKAKLI